MSQPGALTVWVNPGQEPTLAEPIPPMALVSLDVLLSPVWREWLLIDGSDVTVAGHRFRIVGWEQDALLWQHAGPTS